MLVFYRLLQSVAPPLPHPLIMANDSSLEKKDPPSSVVTVSFPTETYLCIAPSSQHLLPQIARHTLTSIDEVRVLLTLVGKWPLQATVEQQLPNQLPPYPSLPSPPHSAFYTFITLLSSCAQCPVRGDQVWGHGAEGLHDGMKERVNLKQYIKYRKGVWQGLGNYLFPLHWGISW